MLRSVDIADYMQHNPAKVLADASLFEAIDIITSRHISGVCVVDAAGHLVGVLSELDCLRAVVSATYDHCADVGSVADFMTREVTVCRLHDNLVDVARDMIARSQRRRPVVDEHGKLIGQLTCRQLLRVVNAFNRRGEVA